jgi:hypothetical protein
MKTTGTRELGLGASPIASLQRSHHNITPELKYSRTQREDRCSTALVFVALYIMLSAQTHVSSLLALYNFGAQQVPSSPIVAVTLGC